MLNFGIGARSAGEFMVSIPYTTEQWVRIEDKYRISHGIALNRPKHIPVPEVANWWASFTAQEHDLYDMA